MVWIPRPCGEVLVILGVEEVRREGRAEKGLVREVSERWRQRIREDREVGSRFAGMWSRVNAAVLTGKGIGD